MSKRNAEVNPLVQYFSTYLIEIDSALNHELDLYSNSELYSPFKYALEGGKRIRPLILLLSKESVLIDEPKSHDHDITDLMAACAIELLHTESVIHDDIIDEESIRRGRPSFHIKFGYNSSILTADFVLGMILNLCSKINNPRITQELSKAAIRMSEGEMMEIVATDQSRLEINDYIKVIENKTASLFEASAKIGGILANAKEEQIQALATYGNLLGIAYQIHDDLIDRNNEDKLFNLLFKNNKNDSEFISNMEILYHSYSQKAKCELNKVTNNISKNHLKYLTNLSSLQF